MSRLQPLHISLQRKLTAVALLAWSTAAICEPYPAYLSGQISDIRALDRRHLDHPEVLTLRFRTDRTFPPFGESQRHFHIIDSAPLPIDPRKSPTTEALTPSLVDLPRGPVVTYGTRQLLASTLGYFSSEFRLTRIDSSIQDSVEEKCRTDEKGREKCPALSLQIFTCNTRGFLEYGLARCKFPWPEHRTGTPVDAPLHGAGRDAAWTRYHWLAMSVPAFVRGPQDTIANRLYLRVSRATAGKRARGDFSDPVPAVDSVFLLSNEYARRASVTPMGRQHRELDAYAWTRSRARIAFQTGVPAAGGNPTATIDDDLAISDICFDEAQDVFIRCEDGYLLGGRRGDETHGTYQVSSLTALRKVEDHDESASLLTVPESSDDEGVSGWEGSPAFSPDGRWLAYLRTDAGNVTCGSSSRPTPPADAVYDSDAERNLWVIRNDPDLDAMGRCENAVNLTAGLEYPILEYRWGCDSRCLLVKVSRDGTTPIAQVDYRQRSNETRRFADLHAWTRLSDDNLDASTVYVAPRHQYVKEFLVSGSGLTLFALLSSLDNATDRIFRCERDAPNASEAFRHVEAPPARPDDTDCARISPSGEPSGVVVEQLQVPRTDQAVDDTDNDPCPADEPERWARCIPTYVAFPKGYDRCDGVTKAETCTPPKFPLVIHFHGGPHDVAYNSAGGFGYLLHHLARGGKAEGRDSVGDKGFVVVTPNIRGSSGYGVDYRRAALRQWGGDAYDDALRIIEYFVNNPDDRPELRGIDPEQVFLMGESFGGYLLNLLQVRGGGGRPDIGTNDIDAMVSFFGPYDLKRFPCTTDQAWFPRFEFGYNALTDGGCSNPPEGTYVREHDPRHWLKRDQGCPAKSPGLCSPDHVRHVPMLLIHGTEDFRVPVEHSELFAAGLRQHAERRQEGDFVKLCRIKGGYHGFDTPTLQKSYQAMRIFFNCAVGSKDSLGCTAQPYENLCERPEGARQAMQLLGPVSPSAVGR